MKKTGSWRGGAGSGNRRQKQTSGELHGTQLDDCVHVRGKAKGVPKVTALHSLSVGEKNGFPKFDPDLLGEPGCLWMNSPIV